MNDKSAFDRLHPALQHHIVNSLGWTSLRPLQEHAIPPVLDGDHALLLAPTAGGKTEAAAFPLLSRMLTEGWTGLSVLYVCPIKALLNNIESRLRGYGALIGRRVALWHGDVSAARRRAIMQEPPDVLLTTPESIEVMLVSTRAEPRVLFRNLQAVVVDELHAFAGDDRGWHLLAVLERVRRLAGREIQRLGLSATIGNPEALLEWLAPDSSRPRRVVAPGGGAARPATAQLDYVGSIRNAAKVVCALYRGEKRLVFCDSRAGVEALAAELHRSGTRTFVCHSSLALDERRRSEEAFAQSRDCVIVATSTLELGIDVGDLDRVIQIDAPGTVASFLQRLGRTGRRPGTLRNCLFLATSDDGFLRASGLLRLWLDGYVESVVPPPEPFHIFAQQLLALALQEGRVGRQTWREWLGAMPAFRAMTLDHLHDIIEFMLARGILFEDGGMLSIGAEGERSFVWAKLYHDRVAIAVGAEVVAEHPRAFCRGAKVLDALHVLPLLERKHRAVAEATALLDWRLAPVWQRARAELAKHTRKPDQEWVRMLRLMETHPAAAVERAVTAALERHSPRLETVRLILRQQQAGPPPVCPPVAGVRPELARITVAAPTLSAYDALLEGC